MSKTLRELQARKAQHVAAMRAITDRAAAESRDITAEEQQQFDALKGQLQSVNGAIERENTLIAEEAQLGIQGALGTAVTDNRVDDPRRGFRSFGEYAQAVRAGSQQGARPDERLLIGAAAPSTYGSEGVGADGGYAIPPEFSRDIFTLSLGEDSLIPMTDNTNVDGNSMAFPKDETTPWGTDGIRAYWQAEAVAANATKPKLGTSILRLHKLMALVPLTDELLADTNALNTYLPKKVGDSIRWKANEAILNGTGAGQPLGCLNSGAVVTVSKDSGQSANTLTALNCANMIAQLPPGSFGRSVWMIHNTTLPSLFTLSLGNYPLYLPLGGGQGAIQASPYGMLLGRPVMVTQHAGLFSALGDLQLHDMSYYRTITKAGGVETATSMHLYFDADATAFRTTFRLDGQPKISAAITQAKGTAKLSPFLKLENR